MAWFNQTWRSQLRSIRFTNGDNLTAVDMMCDQNLFSLAFESSDMM